MEKIPTPEFIYIEECDFNQFPTGGVLSFSKQMIKVFGNRMALVGIVTDDTQVGVWIEKEFQGVKFNFFGILKTDIKLNKKPLIPARLTTYLALKRHLKSIEKIGVPIVFTRTPQFSIALKNSNFTNKSFCFAGTTNSVQISRYPFLRFFSSYYEKILFNSLKTFNTIMASADKTEIKNLIERSEGKFENKIIHSFPTRYDENIFKLYDKTLCRNDLNLPLNKTIFIVTGRLSWIKGWKLIIDSFHSYIQNYNSESILIFLGDGEEKPKMLEYTQELKLNDNIQIVGKVSSETVSKYLNAADIYVVGSFSEGWSNAMIEALGCGKKIVSTNISGASEMVINGVNGYILENRDSEKMATLFDKCTKLTDGELHSLELAKNYNLKTLKIDFEKICLNKQ